MKHAFLRPVRLYSAAAIALLAGYLATPSFAQLGDRKDKEGQVQAEIWKQVEVPPAPVLSPQESLASIQLEPGFRLELVASEPLIHDPVTIDWDEDGRLFVVEMPAYMPDVDGNGEDEPIGRIVVLEDTDGDGRMDQSTVFLDKLVTPRAIAIVKGGVLVAEPPTLWFCEDLDGDLKADRKTKVAEYAKTGSVEHRENALMRGLDNWIYNAKSNRRFKWDGRSLKIEETADRGQWGLSMDDYGRLFYNSNSNPARADFLPFEYSNRNSGYAAKAGLNVNIASSREVFSNRVNTGVNRGYRGPTLRDDYRLATATAASGLAINRGSQYPESYYGNLFVPEPSGNVVMRYRIQEDGFGIAAKKQVVDDPVWEKVDFLASTDERFRPVDIAGGPDGALYIVDMYRGILQHKIFVTTFLRKQILERGLDQPTGLGRIYRIVHERSDKAAPPRLSTMSDAALVGMLGSETGWVRDTAQRLLVERDSISSAALDRLAAAVSSPEELAAIHALWTLEGRGEKSASVAIEGLRHPSEWVRVHTLRAFETVLATSTPGTPLLDAYNRTFTDISFRVRLQAVQSLALVPDRDFVIAKVQRLFHPDLPNPYMEEAIVSSLSGHELAFISEVVGNDRWLFNEGRSSVLGKLAIALFNKRDANSLLALVPLLSGCDPASWKSEAILQGLSAYADRAESKPVKLEQKPDAFYTFLNRLPPVDGHSMTGLEKVFTWPGRESDDPLENLSAAELEAIAQGEALYAATCVACHQKDGNGMPGLAPSLNGTQWVNGSAERLALMVHHGISGEIEVKGELWNSVMPGHGSMPQFQGEGLSQVLSYIRTAWGNKSGFVSQSEIQAILEENSDRLAPWTVDELHSLGL